jgi:hypothetical protein
MQVYDADGLQVSAGGQLCRRYDEESDYRQDGNMFYDDMQRSAIDDISNRRNGNSFGLELARKKKRGYRAPTKRVPEGPTYEQYAHAVMRHVDPSIMASHEQRCWKFFKIVFENKNRVSPEMAAMCINRMFSMKLKSSMTKYRNNKKMRAVLQQFRSTLSLNNAIHFNEK